ncbi:MAG: DNA primase, partial [Gammaproteobacteria bacterium]|nr:DNA primase [Gammaproteobacteria bacterium]
FDGDRAGQQAAWRALENCLPVLHDGVQARFLFLPDGEDPDTLVRKEGQQVFEQRLQTATALSDFMLDHLAEQVNLNSEDGKARFKKLTDPLIARLPDGVFRDLMLEKISRRVGLSVAVMQRHVPSRPVQTHQTQQAGHQKHDIKLTPVRQANALLVQYPELAYRVPLPDRLINSTIAGIDLLQSLYNSITAAEKMTGAILMEHSRGTENEALLHKLMTLHIPDSEDDKQRLRLYQDALNNLVRQQNKQRFEQLLEKQQLTVEEKDELRQLSQTAR